VTVGLYCGDVLDCVSNGADTGKACGVTDAARLFRGELPAKACCIHTQQTGDLTDLFRLSF
jgi:hypothetical protein